MIPFVMSSAIPIAVVIEAKASVWMKMPGIRYSRQPPPPGSGIAPPKTNANRTTNMIDWRIAKIASSGSAARASATARR